MQLNRLEERKWMPIVPEWTRMETSVKQFLKTFSIWRHSLCFGQVNSGNECC